MYNVRHFYTTIYGCKMMLMMPQAVRAKALLIYKKTLVLYMGNFGVIQ